MNKYCVVIATVLCFAMCAGVHADIITNSVTADSDMDDADPNTYFGTNTTMHAGLLGGARRILVEAPIDNIPADQVIQSATLYLYFNPYRDWGIGQVANVHRTLVDWDESTVTWNSNTTSTAWSTPGMAAGTDYATVATDSMTLTAVYSNAMVGFDVTADVAAMYAGTVDNNGWAVLNPNESTASAMERFRTREMTTQSERPYLVVSYAAIPEPMTGTVTLFGGCTIAALWRIFKKK